MNTSQTNVNAETPAAPSPSLDDRRVAECVTAFKPLADAARAVLKNSVDDGGWAFPLVIPPNAQWSEYQCGMSLRDYFAAKAIPAAIDFIKDMTVGACAAEIGLPAADKWVAEIHWPELVSLLAYRFADAMLKARAE